MFNAIKQFLGFKAAAPSSKGGGGSALPPAADPKVKPKQQSYPGYTQTITKVNTRIQKRDANLTNADIVQTVRFGRDTPTIIRDMVRAIPDLSAAVSGHIRVGIPEKYFALARDPDGTLNEQGTQLAFQVLRRWAMLPPYDAGFSQTDSIRSLAEALAKEGILYGAMSAELVLDKGRMPYKLQPVPVTQLFFYPDYSGGLNGIRPVQLIGGEEIDLDIPTFFYVAIDPSLLDPYPQSPIESAIQPALASAQFLQDMRRVMQRHVYPRYVASIIWDKFKEQIPPEILQDPEKLPAYLNSVQAQIENTINGLGVEEALILFDFIEVHYVEGENVDPSNKFDTLKSIIDAKLSTGARAMPAILGHSETQNVASTETVIFMLSANSMVRLKLQEIFSRALTLAVRLFGLDVTVEFEFDPISLRPEGEMEAFKAMEFDRIFKMWSVGLMSDMEASLRMNGVPAPRGFKPMSGTMFYPLAPKGGGAGDNPYSGTGAGGGQSGGGASNQSRAPQTPTNNRGNSK